MYIYELNFVCIINFPHIYYKMCQYRPYSFRKFSIFCRISGSHSGGYEDFYLQGHNAVYSVGSQPTFRRNTSPLSLVPKIYDVISVLNEMYITCYKSVGFEFRLSYHF
jgi:hypothetical protein